MARLMRLLTQQGVVPDSGSKQLEKSAVARWNELLNPEPPAGPEYVGREAGEYWASK